jgi:hypothetical protein
MAVAWIAKDQCDGAPDNTHFSVISAVPNVGVLPTGSSLRQVPRTRVDLAVSGGSSDVTLG